jgi:hemolysin activation/secretion protein
MMKLVAPIPHWLTNLSPYFFKVCLSLLVFWLFLPNAYSQVIQTPASEEQRRRAQVEEQERQRLLQEPRVELPTEAQKGLSETLTLPSETPCFSLHQITLQVPPQVSDQVKRVGDSTLPLDPFFFAHNYLQNYVGKCVGKEGLNLIIQRVTNLILQQGYSTTRVGLAEQDLSSGKLTLTLIPGIIHAIRFSDPSLYGTWRNAFPTGPGKLLNLRDLEQGLEQMKRVPSQDVEMQIVPSEIPGESDVVLTVKRNKAWKVSASLDNSGAKGTGQLQAGANVSVDNLLGLSDLFNVGINTDAERNNTQHGTNGNNVYYAIPMGYWYASISASDYDYHQKIAGNNQSFVSNGKSQNIDAKINYVFQRDQTQKNSAQLNIGKRWSNAFIDGTEIDVQKRNVTYVEAGLIHKHYFGNAQLDFTLLNRWGVSWFGGQQDAEHLPANTPTFQYTLQTIDTTLSVPFSVGSQPFSYIGTLRGQTTSSALYLADQFSIGGRYTVRGFDGELTLTAERGFYLRNELDIPIAGSSHSAYVGLDVGKVFGPSVQYLVGDKLAGAAIGVRGTYKNFSYDLFSSWPIYRPEQFSTSIPSVGFSLNFQY